MIPRPFAFVLALLGAAFVCGAAAARTLAGVELPAAWPPGDDADTHFGVRVPDPYRALEDVHDARVQRWMRAQAEASEQVLMRIPGRQGLLERIREIDAASGGVVARVVRRPEGRLFFTRRNPGEQQFKLILRDTEAGGERVLVDPDALSRAAGRPVALSSVAPSPDGRKLAYTLQAGGSEIGELHVVDVDGGHPLMAPIDRIRSAAIAWLDDGSGFFYSRLREGYDQGLRGERFNDTTRHFRALSGEDRIVFSASRLPALRLPPFATAMIFQVPGTALAAAWVSLGVERNGMLYLGDLDDAQAGRARWRKVVDTSDAVSAFTVADGAFFFRSAKAGPRYQVLRMDMDRPELEHARVVVAQGDAVLSEIAGARDALYFTRREGVNLQLLRLPHGATRAEPVTLPLAGRVDIVDTSHLRDGVVLSLSSWTRVAGSYLLEPGRMPQPLRLAQEGAFDNPPDLQAREVMVSSHDGVRVPLTIIARRDVKLDGRNPTLLYGYGAYGTVEEPNFGPRLLAWFERGGVYAIAHVRGGGIFGRDWHENGRKTTKPNTWKDAIAAAQWLIDAGYASRERLAIQGGSAGGILVGRAITERPDLFAAAVPSVPVLDTVRSETRANGVANTPEYGTVAREDEFRALLAMSSYHAVRDGTQYPAVMLTHGVNDSRVDVWQSSKFHARLSAAQAGGRPVLLRLDHEAGHGQGSSRAQAQQRLADTWSFMLWQFGVPEFQPRE